MLLRSLCLFVLIIVGGLCAPSSFNALSDEDDFPAKNEEHDGDEDGTIWALLVAGCNKNAPLNYACQASLIVAAIAGLADFSGAVSKFTRLMPASWLESSVGTRNCCI